ncbi:OB-fold protein [Bartonella tamiae]|uniref:OB-fold protein n=1 Tax=Bartonella tamiae TaxID=373638 RepID=UPI003CC910CF
MSLFVFMVLSLSWIYHAKAQMPLEEKEEKFITILTTGLAIKYARGDDDIYYIFPDLKRVELRAVAQTVADEFDSNVLKAERTYKNKIIAVDGKIASIQKTPYSGLTIVFDTSNFRHGDSEALLRDDMEDVLADYDVGEEIRLICYGGAVDDLLPTFKDCIVRSEVIKAAFPIAQKIARAFLAGEDISSMVQDFNGITPYLLFFGYKYAAGFAPDNSPCLDVSTAVKCDLNDFMSENWFDSSEFEQAYEDAREKLNLPPFLNP